MTSIPEENFYRVAHLILDEIPSQLRQYFKRKWDTKYPSDPWDDTTVSGQLFFTRERNRTLIKNTAIQSNIQHGDTNKWDGTTLFAVLLYSSHNLLKTDKNADTLIDTLRKLRNTSYGHLDSAKIEDPDYQQIIQDAKNTFANLGWPSTEIAAIETKVLVTRDFQTLKNEMQKERANNKYSETKLNLVQEDVEQVKEKVEKVEDDVKRLKADALLTKNRQSTLDKEVEEQNATSSRLNLKLEDHEVRLSQVECISGNKEIVNYWNVKFPVCNFTGRQNEIKETMTYMEDSNLICIHGIAGVGKTQFVRELVRHVHHSNLDCRVLWIDAGSEISITRSFHDIANALNLPTHDTYDRLSSIESIVTQIYFYLSDHKLLVVLDNAKLFENISFLLPKQGDNKLCIVITSRHKILASSGHCVHIEPLAEEDAILFVKQELGDISITDEELQQLVKVLSCYPLVLQQAIAFIRIHNKCEEYSVTAYLEEFSRKKEEMLSHSLPHEHEYDQNILTAFTLTLDDIREKEFGRKAITIASVIGYFEPSDISYELLLHLFLEREKHAVYEAITLLEDYSVIACSERNHVCSIHELLQTVLQLQDSKSERIYLVQAVSLVASIMEDHTENLTKVQIFFRHVVSIWEHTLKHTNLRLLYTDLGNYIGKAYHELGHYRKSFEIFRDLYQSRSQHLGEDHPATLEANLGVASNVALLGENSRAHEIFETVYGRAKDILGEFHYVTIRSQYAVGECLQFFSKWRESLNILTDVYGKRCQTLGEDHRATLMTRHSIAISLGQLGNWEEALEVHNEIWEKRKNLLGEDNLETLRGRQEIAFSLSKLGNWKESLVIYKEVLEKRESLLGDDHPLTLLSRQSVAACLSTLGNFTDSLEMLTDLYKIKCQHMGKDHFGTVDVLYGIADNLEKLCYSEDVLDILFDVYEKRKCHSGENNQYTKFVLKHINKLLDNQEESHDTHTKVLEKGKSPDGYPHERLLKRQKIAFNLSEMGYSRTALSMYLDVYEERKKLFGESNPYNSFVRYQIKLVELKREKSM